MAASGQLQRNWGQIITQIKSGIIRSGIIGVDYKECDFEEWNYKKRKFWGAVEKYEGDGDVVGEGVGLVDVLFELGL